MIMFVACVRLRQDLHSHSGKNMMQDQNKKMCYELIHKILRYIWK